ncbi:MAG TPA: MarR family winged helix-turn-helix transcriptional regulator [Anaerolineales bacterium]
MSAENQFNKVLHRWVEVFMRRSMREFMEFSRASGLSMSQLSTLFRLYHRGMCDVSGVGEHLGVTNAAASQMVDKLVQLGLLERSEDPHDRRVKQLALTQKGKDLVQESMNSRKFWMEELTTTLTHEDQQAIVKALTLLTDAALALEPSPTQADWAGHISEVSGN